MSGGAQDGSGGAQAVSGGAQDGSGGAQAGSGGAGFGWILGGILILVFLLPAIISVYGEDVVEQKLPADEMLLHFSSLAMHMNGDVILKKVNIKHTDDAML